MWRCFYIVEHHCNAISDTEVADIIAALIVCFGNSIFGVNCLPIPEIMIAAEKLSVCNFLLL